MESIRIEILSFMPIWFYWYGLNDWRRNLRSLIWGLLPDFRIAIRSMALRRMTRVGQNLSDIEQLMREKDSRSPLRGIWVDPLPAQPSNDPVCSIIGVGAVPHHPPAPLSSLIQRRDWIIIIEIYWSESLSEIPRLLVSSCCFTGGRECEHVFDTNLSCWGFPSDSFFAGIWRRFDICCATGYLDCWIARIFCMISLNENMISWSCIKSS